MTPIQQAIAILEEDALTNRIERALEVLRGVPQSPSREALAEAWFVGHCRARGFLFPEIDIQGSKGSFLWGQAMMDAVALLPDTRPDGNSK